MVSRFSWPSLAILHPGHGQKAAGWDPGVVAAVDGVHVEEALVARDYARELAADLVSRGWASAIVHGGAAYDAAHTQAVEIARSWPGQVVYLALHVNGGSGDYGLVEHDARSKTGRAIAGKLAQGLQGLPELDRVQVWETRADSDHAWIRNAHATIDGIYQGRNIAAALVEPGFAGQARHLPLWTGDGPARLGSALGAALHAWAVEAGHMPEIR